MTFKKYGRLTVLEEIPKRNGARYVRCECACGNIKECRLTHLTSGKIVSCGCYKREIVTTGRTGISGSVGRTRLYRCWQSMKSRCYNKNDDSYVHYGGKGIYVCEQWRNRFKPFMEWALEFGYNDELTIDRINPSLGYSPENCRWVTKSVNTTEMLNWNYKRASGQFSGDIIEKITEKNRNNLGAKFDMYLGSSIVLTCECLMVAAEFIVKEKKLSTCPRQIKKNISACLHGKRKTCHGYTFSVR